MLKTNYLLRSFIICTTLLISIPICATSKEVAVEKVTADKADTYELLNLFGDVFERVKRDYVEEIDEQEVIESAINGMLTSLDPHSGYLSEKSFEEMQVQTKGEFGGLGIEVTMENGLVKVVSPIDDTPAFSAGVQAGDYITMIDEEAVMGLSLSEAVEKMRGPVGTDIKITIAREGAKEPLNVVITRDLIKIKSVRSHTEGDIGYVRVTSFSEQTQRNLEKAITQLKKDIPEMKGLVLDLRNNPGGLLDQAISVSDTFLDKGEIVSTRERNPNNSERYSATAGDMIDGLPMVVLINQGSASASEIVAGALKDHNRAVIMGTKSFGKGSVQTVIPLRSHGAMRLTTSRYYTPSGTSIQAKGIVPDIEVQPANIELIESQARGEADLRGSLDNDQSDKQKKDVETKKDNPSDTTVDASVRGLDLEKDYQLNRALDLIRGITIYNRTVTTASKDLGAIKKDATITEKK
jgi:carboxyl-terminal processing protease